MYTSIYIYTHISYDFEQLVSTPSGKRGECPCPFATSRKDGTCRALPGIEKGNSGSEQLQLLRMLTLPRAPSQSQTGRVLFGACHFRGWRFGNFANPTGCWCMPAMGGLMVYTSFNGRKHNPRKVVAAGMNRSILIREVTQQLQICAGHASKRPVFGGN